MQRCVMALILGLVWAPGCAPINREELTKQVLAADPSFEDVLDRHRELANRIVTYQRELALKRSTVEQQIDQLRKELAADNATVRSKIEETKKRIEPDRTPLELSLSVAGEQLRTKRIERASLGRSIAQVRRTLKRQDASLTELEGANQQLQLDQLLRDAARVDQELATLHEHVRLLKTKLLLLKL